MTCLSMNASGFTPWSEGLAKQYRQAGFWTEQTIPEMLEASVSISPNYVALVDGERQWTYQSLLEHVDKLAAGFQSTLNLKSGDKVVLHLPNIGEFYISFLHCLKLVFNLCLRYPLIVIRRFDTFVILHRQKR